MPARALCLVTQVLVDGRDPAFRRPTKPVGPSYAGVEARRLATLSGSARDLVDNRRISALVQGGGYVVASTGPTVVGAVHEATAGWTAP